MNFLMNLIAALGIGFSVVESVAGERAFGAAIGLVCCLVVLVNERNARKPARRRAAPAAVAPVSAASEPFRVEIERLARRVDALERALLAASPQR